MSIGLISRRGRFDTFYHDQAREVLVGGMLPSYRRGSVSYKVKWYRNGNAMSFVTDGTTASMYYMKLDGLSVGDEVYTITTVTDSVGTTTTQSASIIATAENMGE